MSQVIRTDVLPSYRVSADLKSVAQILHELWQYRSVIWILTMRDIKVRYKQTYIGFAWYILQPLGYMLIFTLVFSFVFARGKDSLSYSLFALSGIILWMFFSRSISLGATSFQSFQNIQVGGALLAILMLIFQVAIAWKILWFPVFLVGTMLLSIGLAIFFGSMDVRYRDIRHTLTFVTQLWMFSTPIMYPIDIVPVRFRDIYALNPMVGLMEGFRWSVFADTAFPEPRHLVFSAVATAIALLAGIYSFRRSEGTLVDML